MPFRKRAERHHHAVAAVAVRQRLRVHVRSRVHAGYHVRFGADLLALVAFRHLGQAVWTFAVAGAANHDLVAGCTRAGIWLREGGRGRAHRAELKQRHEGHPAMSQAPRIAFA